MIPREDACLTQRSGTFRPCGCEVEAEAREKDGQEERRRTGRPCYAEGAARTSLSGDGESRSPQQAAGLWPSPVSARELGLARSVSAQAELGLSRAPRPTRGARA